MSYRLLFSKDQTSFLPGETTHGHYQIELACDACHDPFMGVKEDACMECHGERLKLSKDSHPKEKFLDPRNADRVEILDARKCVTCHQEHRPDITLPMGLTLQGDYCYYCHKDIAEERPSHAGMGFDTCATAGCHHFHDNTALYEEFLVKHADGPDMLPEGHVLSRDEKESVSESLAIGDRDAPSDVSYDAKLLAEWAGTAHARAGVNCTDCHGSGADWTDKPSMEACSSCHKEEVKGFESGRHGMRLAQGLSPMRPGLARLPMKSDSLERELTCNACHGAHGFDTRQAAVESCMACHDDAHTRAYEGSAHYRLWLKETSGEGLPGTGVSCATCHLPRQIHKSEKGKKVVVQHNQNFNLRPNEKMIRSVCMDCHSLRFSIDALADRELVERNFTGRPARHIESIDMAIRRK